MRLRPYEHGYGVLLALILLSLVFQLAASQGELTHVITILLQGGVFLAALWTSQARTRWLHLGTGLVAVVTVAAAIAFAANGQVDDAGARIVAFILAAIAPIAIFHGLVRHFRDQGRVTLQTMFGVLCIYLLFGALFAYAYGVVADLGSSPFFATGTDGDTSDYLYFSFTTMTTTGYGDLTAAGNLGRSIAIGEQLVGQIYLVTVVAVIVGNLSRNAGRAR